MSPSKTPRLVVCLPGGDNHVDGERFAAVDFAVRKAAERLGFKVGETEVRGFTAISVCCQNGGEESWVYFDWYPVWQGDELYQNILNLTVCLNPAYLRCISAPEKEH